METHLNKQDLEAYRIAAQLVQKNDVPKEFKAIKSDWNWEIAKSFGVGRIIEIESFKNSIVDTVKGMSKARLKRIGLMDSRVFAADNVIFTLRDQYGRVIGFVGRKAAEDSSAHFYSTYIPHLDIDKYLFGSDRSGDEYIEGDTPLILTLGWSDLISLRINGLTNALSLGRTVVNRSQFDEIKRLGYKDIILAFDSTEDGYLATEKFLALAMESNGFTRIQILHITEPESDPDDYIRKYGVKKFSTAPITSPFDWKLSLLSDKDKSIMSGTDIANMLIPYIILEKNILIQNNMISRLSEISKLPPNVLEEETDRRKALQSAALYDQIEDIKNGFSRRLRTMSPEDFINQTRIMTRDIEQVMETRKNQVERDPIKAFNNSLKDWMNATEEISGLKCLFNEFTQKLDGIPRAGAIINVAGSYNTGKSALLTSLSLGILESNPLEDLVVLHFSVDDTQNTTFARYIANISELSICAVMNPRFKLAIRNDRGEIEITNGNPRKDPMLWARYDAGVSKVKNWIGSGRLAIYGAVDGNTLTFMEDKFRQIRKKFPDKTIIAICDNFHDVADYPGSDERIRFKRMSEDQKLIAAKYSITWLNAVELTKGERGKEPTSNSIAETNKINYRADVNILLYNDLNDMRERAKWYIIKNINQPAHLIENRQPIVKASFDKNKLSSFKGHIMFKFISEQSRMVEISKKSELDYYHGNKQQ